MKHILCFGDSNTWGYDTDTYDITLGIVKRMPFEVRWPGLLQNSLGPKYRIIENALNGRTCMHDDPYFPHRLGLHSLEEALDANAPLDLVIFQLGVNELKHMFNLTAGMISYGMEKLVRTAQTSYYDYPVPKVLLIAPHPAFEEIADGRLGFTYGPLAHSKSLELAGLYRNVAERNSCAFLDCGQLDFSLNTLDGFHYSRQDHKKLAGEVKDIVLEIIPV